MDPKSPIKLLIVDDNAPWRSYLKVMLGHPVFQLAEAPDGLRAVQFLAKHKVDVVVTDTDMPGMDGIALTEKIRAEYPGTNVILLFSGKFNPGHPRHQAASLCGANLILTKDEVEGPLMHYLIALMKPQTP